jgi:hypothetical protein
VPTDLINYSMAFCTVTIIATQIELQADVLVHPAYDITSNINLYDIPLIYSNDYNIVGITSFKPNQQLIAGHSSYDWIFVPEDSDYTTVEGSILLDVNSSDELVRIFIKSEIPQPYECYAGNIIQFSVKVSAEYKNSLGMPFLKDAYFWTVEYGNEFGVVVAGQEYVTINYLGFRTQLQIHVNSLDFDTERHSVEYVGPTEYSEGFELLPEHFVVDDMFKGEILLEDIKMSSSGSNVTIRFVPDNLELFYNADSDFTMSFSFNLYLPKLLTDIYIDDELVDFATGENYIEVYIESGSFELKVSFDDTLYRVEADYYDDVVRLENGTAKLIKLGISNEIILFMSSLEKNIVVEEYYIYIVVEKYVESITYSRFDSEELLNFDFYTSGGVITEYYANIENTVFTGLQIEMKEGYTYELFFEDQPFDIENLYLGLDNIDFKIYSNNVLLETRNIKLNYVFYETLLYVSSGDGIHGFYVDTMEVNGHRRYIVEGDFGNDEFLIEYAGEESFELYSTEGALYETLPKLNKGKNVFIGKIIYKDNDVAIGTISFELYIYNQNIYVTDYIQSIKTNVENGNDIYFEFYGNYINTTRIHRYYSNEEIYNALEITKTQLFINSGYELLTTLVGEIVECVIMDGDTVFYEFIIEFNFYGEVSSDTEAWYSIYFDGVESNEEKLPRNQEIMVYVGAEIDFYVNEYVQFSMYSDAQEIDIYDLSIHFSEVGSYEVTFVIISADRTVTETFTITFVVAPRPSLLIVEFSNQELLKLNVDLEAVNFGSYQIGGLNIVEEENLLEISLFKQYSKNKLTELITNDKMIVNFSADVDFTGKLFISGIAVTKFSDVELTPIINGTSQSYEFEYIIDIEEIRIFVTITIVFMDFEPILTIEASNNDVVVTKSLGIYKDALIGDFDKFEYFQYEINMFDSTEIFNDGEENYHVILDITIADGYYLYDMNRNSIESGSVSVDVMVNGSEDQEYKIVGLALSVLTMEEIDELLDGTNPEYDVYELSVLIKGIVIYL